MYTIMLGGMFLVTPVPRIGDYSLRECCMHQPLPECALARMAALSYTESAEVLRCVVMNSRGLA